MPGHIHSGCWWSLGADDEGTFSIESVRETFFKLSDAAPAVAADALALRVQHVRLSSSTTGRTPPPSSPTASPLLVL